MLPSTAAAQGAHALLPSEAGEAAVLGSSGVREAEAHHETQESNN